MLSWPYIISAVMPSKKQNAKDYLPSLVPMQSTHLDRVSQRDGDSERQALWDSYHQHSDSNDEKLDKVLDVNRGALCEPRVTCNNIHHTFTQIFSFKEPL